MRPFPTRLFTLTTSPYPFAAAEESEGRNWTAEQTDWIPSFTFWIYSTRRSSTVPNKFHPWRISTALAEDSIVQTSLRSLSWMFTRREYSTHCEYSSSKSFSVLKSHRLKALVLKAKGFLKATLLRKGSLFFQLWAVYWYHRYMTFNWLTKGIFYEDILVSAN